MWKKGYASLFDNSQNCTNIKDRDKLKTIPSKKENILWKLHNYTWVWKEKRLHEILNVTMEEKKQAKDLTLYGYQKDRGAKLQKRKKIYIYPFYFIQGYQWTSKGCCLINKNNAHCSLLIKNQFQTMTEYPKTYYAKEGDMLCTEEVFMINIWKFTFCIKVIQKRLLQILE